MISMPIVLNANALILSAHFSDLISSINDNKADIIDKAHNFTNNCF